MLALLLATLAAQQPVPNPKWGEDPHAPRGYQFFGEGLADIGDVDSDRLDDFTISDPGSVPATIWIVSGRDGRVIETLCSDDETRGFGESISALPDVDGDGIGEILVGLSPDGYESAPGRVAIYSGRTRLLLRTIDAPAGVTGFGAEVAGLADVDGDGSGDVLVTARCGSGYVYSGSTGRLLYDIEAPTGVEGRHIDPIGDIDADGVPDLAFVGLITKEHSPLLRLHSGRDGSVLCEVDTQITSDGVGVRTLAIEDLDNDGLPDVLFCSRGVMQARSAFDLHLLSSFDTPDLRPSNSSRGVARLGDIDGDRVKDIVLGNPEDEAGSMAALSVRTGKVLWKRETPWTWRNVDLCNAGQEIVAIRDTDHDAVREFLSRVDSWRDGGPRLVFVSSGKDGHLICVLARGPGLSLLCLGPKG